MSGRRFDDLRQVPAVTPDRLGRYRVVGILGRGGMGVVYHAHDDQLDRPIAIKVVGDANATAIERERLQREARSAARIRHPHVCQIFDIGEQNGEPFIAMELLEGEALSERLRRGPLPVSEAVPHALRILDALQTLHDNGIVHRDLKPSNVFLTNHGPKLLDFGVARNTASVSENVTERPLTAEGTPTGTLGYMSPEQCRGEQVDVRSDLFSVGVMIFEMLTGKSPFPGRTAAEVYHAVLYEQPAALGGSPAIAIIDSIIRRALAKDPAERIQTAAEMAEALRPALAVESSGAPTETRVITRLMVLPFRMLRADPEIDFLALSLPDAISLSLAGLGSLVVRSHAAAARYAGDAPDLKRISNEAQVDVVLMGTIMRAGQLIRVSAQLLTTPEGTVLWSDISQVTLKDVFQLQDEIVTRIVESLSMQLSAPERRRRERDVPASAAAYELYLRGNQILVQGLRSGQDLSIARDLYLRCVEDDPNYAPAWARLGRCYWLLSKGLDNSAHLLEQAESCFQRALALNPDLALAHNLYGQLEPDLKRATEATVRLLGRIQQGRAEPELYVSLIHACRYCGLLEASVEAYERARRLDPTVPTSVNQTYYQLGDLARSQKTMGPGTAYLDALILFEQGKTVEAMRIIEERERGNLLPLTRAYIGSLRALIEGKRDESIGCAMHVYAHAPDGEGLIYQARTLSVLGEGEKAVTLLEAAFDRGFNPYRLLRRPDPWLDSARSHSRFAHLDERARDKYINTRQAFVDANGERLLGVTVPLL
jgi:eukaryotic-like serine/threonine-protein kinase